MEGQHSGPDVVGRDPAFPIMFFSCTEGRHVCWCPSSVLPAPPSGPHGPVRCRNPSREEQSCRSEAVLEMWGVTSCRPSQLLATDSLRCGDSSLFWLFYLCPRLSWGGQRKIWGNPQSRRRATAPFSHLQQQRQTMMAAAADWWRGDADPTDNLSCYSGSSCSHVWHQR